MDEEQPAGALGSEAPGAELVQVRKPQERGGDTPQQGPRLTWGWGSGLRVSRGHELCRGH